MTGAFEELFDFNRPAEGIFLDAPLNSGKGIIKMLSNFSDFSAVNGVFLALVSKLADGRNNCCGSASCGPEAPEKYQLTDKDFDFTFKIKPVKFDN